MERAKQKILCLKETNDKRGTNENYTNKPNHTPQGKYLAHEDDPSHQTELLRANQEDH